MTTNPTTLTTRSVRLLMAAVAIVIALLVVAPRVTTTAYAQADPCTASVCPDGPVDGGDESDLTDQTGDITTVDGPDGTTDDGTTDADGNSDDPDDGTTDDGTTDDGTTDGGTTDDGTTDDGTTDGGTTDDGTTDDGTTDGGTTDGDGDGIPVPKRIDTGGGGTAAPGSGPAGTILLLGTALAVGAVALHRNPTSPARAEEQG